MRAAYQPRSARRMRSASYEGAFGRTYSPQFHPLRAAVSSTARWQRLGTVDYRATPRSADALAGLDLFPAGGRALCDVEGGRERRPHDLEARLAQAPRLLWA